MMTPDAPKVGNSGTETPEMNRAADEAQSTIHKKRNLEERWKRVQSASENYKAGGEHAMHQTPQDDRQRRGNAGNEAALGEDAAASDMGGEDDVTWKSAMDRFEQESPKTSTDNIPNERWDAVGYLEDDHPPTLGQMQSQEQQDQEYARRMGEMDRMGGVEMDYEQPSQEGAGEHINESTEKVSLWETFKVLYKQNPMIKYYILGLLILLVATAAIIGVSVSQKNKSSSKDCATASYTEEPFLLLPESSQSVRAGKFGTSISASSDYLIVGAPNSACNSQGSSCANFTVGGEAYLYKRNNKNEWALYSLFILDDDVSSGDQFGKSVAVAEDSTTVVVGAPKDDGLEVVAGAIYVMEQPFSSTTPPIRLVSNDIGFNDEFGGAVSIAATTLGRDSPVRVTNVVVGASFDDDFGSSSGGAYVFSKFDGEPPASACGGDRSIEVGKWIQCQKLLPDDGQTNDQFGKTVDISGRTIVVGAMWDDDRGIDSGAAYVYSLGDDGTWGLQQKLLPVNFESQANRFGVAVATSGERIVVGADLDDSLGEDSGAAYIYRLSNGVWDLEGSKLVPNIEPGTGDHRNYECGFSVDIDNAGTTVVVGCPEAPGGGVAYVHNLQENGEWIQTEKLSVPGRNSDTGMQLGSSVALSSGEDGMAVVGYGESNGEVFSYRKDC